ncbi:Hypothetical protein NGAL_HAMBI2605_10270 [Neorhizobium galegae bv. orientalis]|nr:Hypothetical protein NGAL_HAMBI2605_10270 [Neorhizobium galegae bv. orientalis]
MSTLTPPEHEHSAAVEQAAIWLAEEHSPPAPLIPELRRRFDLSALEATEACAMAQRFRMLRRAHG